MGDSTSGMGAEVSARKIEDGSVTEEEGDFTQGPSRRAWIIFLTMVGLSTFGIWKVGELVIAVM